MPYATPADFLAILRRDETVALSQIDNPDEPLADTESIGRFLSDAAARIDAQIAVKYSVPISTLPPPPMLVQINVWIARYWMELGGEIRTEVQSHYDAAMADLMSIASGTIPLLDNAGNVIDRTEDRDATAPQSIGVINRIAVNPWAKRPIDSWGWGWQRWY